MNGDSQEALVTEYLLHYFDLRIWIAARWSTRPSEIGHSKGMRRQRPTAGAWLERNIKKL